MNRISDDFILANGYQDNNGRWRINAAIIIKELRWRDTIAIMRRIFAIMALVSILLLLGVVGGVDAGTMPLGKGAMLCFCCLGSLAGSTWLAGGFDK